MLFLEKFKLEKDNINSVVSYIEKGKTKTWDKGKRCRSFEIVIFRDRTSDFSLKYWTIRPSAVIGTRREATLRREGFSWVPDLGSFVKFREVGVSPNLGFILRLSTM